MSERREKRNRFYQKMQYIAEFEFWLANEPPIFYFFEWRKWKNNRPKRTW